jgi:hypothetical protein
MKQKWALFMIFGVLFVSFLFHLYSQKSVIAAIVQPENAESALEAKKDIAFEQKEEQKASLESLINKIPTTPQKVPISLHDVAAGFSQFANTYKQKKQSEDELSLTETRFLEKILQSVGTICSIYRNKLISYIHENTLLHCIVSLSKNGLIEQCAISKTSGNNMLDALIKQIILEAGTSFPLLPKSIEKIPYYLIFKFEFQGRLSFSILLPR